MQSPLCVLSNNEEFYQIQSVLKTEIIFPYCHNCYKNVLTIANKKKWLCSSCNEEYTSVNYRYRLMLEVTNYKEVKCISIFGTQADKIIGTNVKEFNKYLQKLETELVEKEIKTLLSKSFDYCLIGKWFAFEFKKSNKYNVVSKFRIARSHIDDYIPIYEFLEYNFQKKIENLNFSDSLESIIDSTLDKTNLECNDDSLHRSIKKTKIFNEIIDVRSPLIKNVNKWMSAISSTPIFKRLTRR